MKTTEYELLVQRIDKAIAKGGFPFEYRDYETENNVFYGKRYNPVWKKAIAVKRKDQMIIDQNGVYFSVLKEGEIRGK